MLTQVQIIIVLVAVISFVAGVIFRSRFKNSGDVNDALLEDVDTLEDAVKEWREKYYELKEAIKKEMPLYYKNKWGHLVDRVEETADYYENLHNESRLRSREIDAKWNDRIESLKKVQSLKKTEGAKRGLVVSRQFVVDSINRGHGSDAQD